jgi:hypothetical protein
MLKKLRQKKVLLLLLLLLLCGSVAWWYFDDGPPGTELITKDVYDKIALGMTEKQVLALMPCPPGGRDPGRWPYYIPGKTLTERVEFKVEDAKESTRKHTADGGWDSFDSDTGKALGKTKFWQPLVNLLGVTFDGDGKVVGKVFMPMERPGRFRELYQRAADWVHDWRN